MAARHRSAQRSRLSGVVSATLATLLGAILLSSGLGTWSSWRQSTTMASSNFQAGKVTVTGGSWSIQLHSQQSAGSRTYASSATCTVPSGYVECRDVTATLGSERLIPGDRIRVVRTFTVAGAGNNLKGNYTLDAASLLDKSASASLVAQQSTLTYTFTNYAGTKTTGTNGVQAYNSITPSQFGTYTVQVDIATPTKNGTADWGTAAQGFTIPLGNVTATFQQV